MDQHPCYYKRHLNTPTKALAALKLNTFAVTAVISIQLIGLTYISRKLKQFLYAPIKKRERQELCVCL
jgi:hypothetical protein